MIGAKGSGPGRVEALWVKRVRLALVLALVAPTAAVAGPAALAASDEGCPSPAGPGHLAQVPVANVPCGGVRPGAIVRTPTGRCSFSFMFAGSDGHTYAATAGHCLFKDEGRPTVWPAGQAPAAWDVGGRYIGEFAYAEDWIDDFALIRVADGVEVEPAMCHWGGPTSLYGPERRGPVVLRHFGYGIGISDVVPARTGAAVDSGWDERQLSFFGAVDWGDSGSALMTSDGAAVGTIVSLGADIGGNNNAQRLTYSIPRAEAALGIELELLTAPLAARP